MSICKENIVDVELTNGMIFRSFNNETIGEGDINGNKYGARLLKNGEPVSLAGVACVGCFTRSDGITLIIDGHAQDGKVYVELPQAAYAVEGNFTLAIKASGTGFASTVRIIDGTVVNTTTETIADPSEVIPDLSDYEELVEAAETAAGKIEKIHTSAVQITGTRYRITVTIDE